MQKRFTGVLVGFSEGGEKMDSCNPELKKKEDDEEEEFGEILGTLKSLSEKINKHSEMFRKKGSPKVKQALSLVIDNLNNYKKEVSKMDNQETVTMSEQVEKYKKELEDTFKIQLAELKAENERKEKDFEENKKVADERVRLAEERVAFLEAKDARREDDVFLSEIIRQGKVLPKDKEKELKRLEAARKAGTLKLSESESFNYYQDLRDELSNRPVVIQYAEIGSSNPEGAGNGSDVIALAEKLVKENGMPRKDAMIQAKKQLNYNYTQATK